MGSRVLALIARERLTLRAVRSGAARRSGRGGTDFEHGMLGRGALELLVGGVGPDAFEEHSHLGLPALQVRAQDRRLLAVVDDLRRAETLRAPPDQQPALAAGAEIAHPLRVAARRYEIPVA